LDLDFWNLRAAIPPGSGSGLINQGVEFLVQSMSKRAIQPLLPYPPGGVPGVVDSSLVLAHGPQGHHRVSVMACTVGNRVQFSSFLRLKVDFERGQLPMQDLEKWMDYFRGTL
jgi:hypothetical protein